MYGIIIGHFPSRTRSSSPARIDPIARSYIHYQVGLKLADIKPPPYLEPACLLFSLGRQL